MSKLAWLGFAGALWLGMSLPVAGQNISGTVVEKSTGEGVRGALVILHPSSDAQPDTTITLPNGTFVFGSMDSGRYVVEVRHLAYDRHVTRLLTLRPRQSLELRLELEAMVVALEDVQVEAQRRLPHMERGGFYERRALGVGRVIDRETIERTSPQSLSDILRRVPGFIAVENDVQLQRFRHRGCWPTIVIDDTPFRMHGERRGYALDALVMPEIVEAIEVHSRASGLPARYGGRNSPCGAILIWTRQSLR